MKYFLIAGEASGDRLGAALMIGLQTLRPGNEAVPGVEFSGVGGPLMEAEGLISLFPMEELSLMGIIEILPKYLHLKRRIRETAAAVLASGADALITIDSPDFCLRVAALVRRARPDFRIIHYVAPSVWAWRPGRAKKMARYVDHVLALLPFEPPYMTAAGMTCDFVGHPVVSEPLASAEERIALDVQLQGRGPLILALPGSRRGEVQRLMPVLGEVMQKICEQYPDAQVILPTVRGVAGLVTQMSENWPVKPLITMNRELKRAAFAEARVAIAASGTVSLELAANDCPMVIAYDMNRLTLRLMRRAALIDTVTLVNLVAQTRAVPEFIGENCRADLIAPQVLALLKNGTDTQRQAMSLTMDRLGRGDEPPGLRAARSVLWATEGAKQIAPVVV